MPFFPLTISRSVKQRTRSPYVAKRNTGRANTSHPDSVGHHGAANQYDSGHAASYLALRCRHGNLA